MSPSLSDDMSPGPIDTPSTLEAIGGGASEAPVATAPPTEPSSSTTTATVPADPIVPQALDSAAILACLATLNDQVRDPTLPLPYHVVVWP